MMNNYAMNWGIDTLQNQKKYYVDTFVKDEALAAPMKSYIDIQTDYAKDTLKSVDEFTQAMGKTISKWMGQ